MVNKRRFEALPVGVMIDLLEQYENAVKEISNTYTIAFTGEVYGNRNDITDDMIRNLHHASNMLWTAVMNAEVNKMMSEASKS